MHFGYYFLFFLLIFILVHRFVINFYHFTSGIGMCSMWMRSTITWIITISCLLIDDFLLMCIVSLLFLYGLRLMGYRIMCRNYTIWLRIRYQNWENCSNATEIEYLYFSDQLKDLFLEILFNSNVLHTSNTFYLLALSIFTSKAESTMVYLLIVS